MMQVHEPTVRTRTWPIGDMVSTGCARTLEKAVAALPGVNATSANFATATLRKMHQNLGWAVGYNVLAFPLAAGVLYPFVLSPEIAALSMSGSSVIVAVNALLLRRVRLAPRNDAVPSSTSANAAA